MTNPFAKLSPLSGSNLTRLLLSFALAVALASPTRADEIAALSWQGSYHSNALGKEVVVRLTLPANTKPGLLRFVTLSCEVGLQKATADATGASVYGIDKTQNAAGPYCGNWLGGSLKTWPGVSGHLKITVTKGNSSIQTHLEPVR
jgi:hypothetical protein